jgi:hypothetical protein
MSDIGYEEYDEILPDEPNGELVHWMEPRPMTFGPGGLSLAIAGAFALGLATALIAVGLTRLTGPDRRTRLQLAPKLRSKLLN